jgi:hypothetical protein
MDALARLEAVMAAMTPPLTKDEAPCCRAALDEQGRPPIGFCGPDCVRRP